MSHKEHELSMVVHLGRYVRSFRIDGAIHRIATIYFQTGVIYIIFDIDK